MSRDWTSGLRSSYHRDKEEPRRPRLIRLLSRYIADRVRADRWARGARLQGGWKEGEAPLIRKRRKKKSGFIAAPSNRSRSGKGEPRPEDGGRRSGKGEGEEGWCRRLRDEMERGGSFDGFVVVVPRDGHQRIHRGRTPKDSLQWRRNATSLSY